jgi:hypothetical protein
LIIIVLGVVLLANPELVPYTFKYLGIVDDIEIGDDVVKISVVPYLTVYVKILSTQLLYPSIES